MDNRGNIVSIQSGFLRHNIDSAQLQMMPRIGNGEELHLPAGLYILADKEYLCEYPILTPRRAADVGGDQRRQLFNLELRRVGEIASVVLKITGLLGNFGCFLRLMNFAHF